MKAYKAELEVLAVSDATATASTNANLENVLAPYKEALEKLAPIEKSVKNYHSKSIKFILIWRTLASLF